MRRFWWLPWLLLLFAACYVIGLAGGYYLRLFLRYTGVPV